MEPFLNSVSDLPRAVFVVVVVALPDSFIVRLAMANFDSATDDYTQKKCRFLCDGFEWHQFE